MTALACRASSVIESLVIDRRQKVVFSSDSTGMDLRTTCTYVLLLECNVTIV